MEDFKRIVKMKTGGSVSKAIAAYEKRERKVEEKDDEAQDKKVVKKAFSIHDTQQHEAKTDLSKLSKGGRAKKSKGTVKKFCGGKGVKKYEEGGSVFDNIKAGAVKLKENILGTPEQNKIGQEALDKQATQGSKLAKFLGGKNLAGQGAITEQERSNINKKRGGKVC